jgi:DMSO reductase anchor subunit
MFYAALFCALFLVVGAFYFLSNRKQNRAPGLREAMAIIAGLIAIVIFWIYRSRG